MTPDPSLGPGLVVWCPPCRGGHPPQLQQFPILNPREGSTPQTMAVQRHFQKLSSMFRESVPTHAQTRGD